MSPISQIRLHQGDHLPSGSDALPWYGTPVAASGVPGIATVGTLADMPAATAGTQSGSDGAAAGTGFTSTSGLFTAANTGDTIAITDVGVTPAVVYSFTVTYSSQTALTLSGAGWSGTATADLPWVLSGSGPSNQGLWYFATDDTTAPTTGSMYLSDGVEWLNVAGPGGGGGGEGIQFGGTELSPIYGPTNSGDYLYVFTQGGDDGPVLGGAPCGILIANQGDADAQFALVSYTDGGILIEDEGTSHSAGVRILSNGGQTLIKNDGAGPLTIENDSDGLLNVIDYTGNGLYIGELGGGVLTLDVTGGLLNFAGIPTSNPGGSGNVWSNLGILQIT